MTETVLKSKAIATDNPFFQSATPSYLTSGAIAFTPKKGSAEGNVQAVLVAPLERPYARDMPLFEVLFKQAHCRLLIATDGLHALQLAREEHPDLMLLDIQMPKLSGFEVAEALQQDSSTEEIPVLFVTEVSGYPIFTPEGKHLAEKNYIGKPFQMEYLVKRILKKIEEKGRYKP